MKTLHTTTTLLAFFLLLLASCQSSQPVFSKRGEEYRSAREIAEAKRQERRARRLARRNGGDDHNLASKEQTSRNRARSSRHLEKNVATVVQAARSYTGTPYKWGGTTRIGMDCSGLLCASFQSIDVLLPRTSEEQSRFGNSIRTKDIKEGDLVFFGANKHSRDITHVGMVTEVINDKEVKFIHASTSLGVVENNLYSDYYQRIFIKAVRPPVF